MTQIFLSANGTVLSSRIDGKITSGTIGLDVHIEYDDQWASLNKTAFFKSGDFVRKRDGIGVYTTVPWEVLRKHGKTLEIGLEGRDSDGKIVMPTVWATVGTIYQGAQGEIPAAPNPGNDEPGGSYGSNIDDSQISLSSTWSSQKISDEIKSGVDSNVLKLYATSDTIASNNSTDVHGHLEKGGYALFTYGEYIYTCVASNYSESTFIALEDDTQNLRIIRLYDDSSFEMFISAGGGSAEGAVLYTEQDLTQEEKAQARANLWEKAPSVNMFNLATAVKGYYLYPTNGAITAHADMYCTYIPVTSAGSFIFRVPRNKIGAYNSTMIPLYDADKNFVRFVTVTSLEDNSGEVGQLTQMTLSASDLVGVASFGFNVYKTQLAAAMVVAGTEYPESYIPYAEVMSIPELNINSETVAGMVTNPLYKKVIAFTGDSICEGRANNGGGYAKIIGERNSMTVQNLGVSGGKITTGTTSFCISESVLNMREDADYVILEGGVNDMAMDNLGTISNNFTATLDTTTFCGAFEQMIKSAIARFPGKKIGYIAVHRLKQWAPDEYNTLHQNTGYYEAAINICKKWGIPVCNLTINCPSLYENDSLKQVYTTNADGWHPNEEGYKKYYVPKIEAWLKTL